MWVPITGSWGQTEALAGRRQGSVHGHYGAVTVRTPELQRPESHTASAGTRALEGSGLSGPSTVTRAVTNATGWCCARGRRGSSLWAYVLLKGWMAPPEPSARLPVPRGAQLRLLVPGFRSRWEILESLALPVSQVSLLSPTGDQPEGRTRGDVCSCLFWKDLLSVYPALPDRTANSTVSDCALSPHLLRAYCVPGTILGVGTQQ